MKNYQQTLERLRLRQPIPLARWKKFAEEYERRHGLVARLDLAEDLRLFGDMGVCLRSTSNLVTESATKILHMDDVADDVAAILSRVPERTNVTHPSSSPEDDYGCLVMYVNRMEEIRTELEKLYDKIVGEGDPSNA